MNKDKTVTQKEIIAEIGNLQITKDDIDNYNKIAEITKQARKVRTEKRKLWGAKRANTYYRNYLNQEIMDFYNTLSKEHQDAVSKLSSLIVNYEANIYTNNSISEFILGLSLLFISSVTNYFIVYLITTMASAVFILLGIYSININIKLKKIYKMLMK